MSRHLIDSVRNRSTFQNRNLVNNPMVANVLHVKSTTYFVVLGSPFVEFFVICQVRLHLTEAAAPATNVINSWNYELDGSWRGRRRNDGGNG